MAAEEFFAEGLVSYREIARLDGVEPSYLITPATIAVNATLDPNLGPFRTVSGEII